ncbi:MAG: hypothetical protein HDR07_10990 [Lachnospiraceae bacterium]|nr:hypothetical protein [Lachnospiraceae bacterium]
MIHNIMESITDEELTRLIEQVEERELIHAPGHLKENVFLQLDRQRRTAKKRQLFSYRAKVLVGMAAALTVLFLVPADGAEKVDSPRNSILSSLLPEKEAGGVDEWEQDAIERQQDIDKTWERYREDQARADARKQYFQDVKDKLQNIENWEVE